MIFSGKKSRKVDGLYKPETREIILHTGNFTTDDELVYTAIHEYAHHLQFTTSAMPISCRAHTTAFWSLFHDAALRGGAHGLSTTARSRASPSSPRSRGRSKGSSWRRAAPS